MDQTACDHLKPARLNSSSDNCHSVTPLVERLGVNLLEPLRFGEAEYGNWIKRHVCGLCGSSLLARFGPGRTWIVFCPEHGDMHEGQYVTRRQWSKAEQGALAGLMEMR